MRKLYIPIKVDPAQNRELYLKDFDRLGVDHVFLECGERWPLISAERKNKCMDMIEEALQFYTAKGYECGVWICTLGFGGALASDARDTRELTQIRSITGKDGGDALCPLNGNFVDSTAKTVHQICWYIECSTFTASSFRI